MAVLFGFFVDLVNLREDSYRAKDKGITVCNLGIVVISLSRRAFLADYSDHLSLRGELVTLFILRELREIQILICNEVHRIGECGGRR